MAVRHRFGNDISGWVFSIDDTTSALVLQPGVAITVWDSQTGGTQYTDLKASNGTTSITSVTTGTGDSAGLIPVFYGPLGVAAMWAQAGSTGPRVLISANDLGDSGAAGSTETLYALGNRSGPFTIDQANGTTQTVTLIGNVSPTIPAPDAVGKDLSLIITQDATGSRTVTWPTNVVLANGSLKLSTTPAAVDLVSFRWDGTSWRERSRALSKSQDSFTSLVNVRAFGAKADGGDDRPAIQDAIDFAAAIGTGIYLPIGTYSVSPNPTSKICLRLTVGLKGIYGAHASQSIIRVLGGSIDYHSILSNYSLVAGYAVTQNGAAGMELRDFTVDQNTTNNLVANPATVLGSYPRVCVSLGAVTGGAAQITNVRCVDTDNLWSIYFQGRDVTIRDCELVVSTAASDHDHSAVYTQISVLNGHSTIVNNLIYAPTAGNIGARTGIETHGGTQHVAFNTIRNYFKGANLTGVAVYTGEGASWIGNNFLNVRFGIQLWSVDAASYHTPCSNVIISHNTFLIDPVSWTPSGSTYTAGIFLDVAADNTTLKTLAYQDVTISNNYFRVLSNPRHVGNVGDTANHIIDWRRVYAPLNTFPVDYQHDRNIRIENNTMEGAIASGIRYTSVAGDYIDGLIIRGNRIRNPGQGTIAGGGGNALPNGYGNGIMIVGAIKNSRIENNDIIDDQPTRTLNVGLHLVPSSGMTGGVNNIVRNNRVVGALVAPYQFSPAVDGGYFLEGDVATWAAPTGTVALGSQLRAADTGLMYRQTVSPIGSGWSSYTPGATGGSGGGVSPTPPDIAPFPATGTWTKPAGAKVVVVTCIAAGGGGGSGARGPAGNIRAGGGGGGGGGVTQVTLDAASLAATVTVTVGAGGAGGAAVTVDSTVGNPGTAGGNTTFGTSVRAQGGTGGGGGTFAPTGTVTGAAGSGNVGTSVGGNGAAASTTGGAGNNAALCAGAPGGGAGGGITSGNTANNGGGGVSSWAQPAGGTAGSAGTVDTTQPTAGGSAVAGHPLAGGSGGGGAASITTAAQSGADGGAYGAGGGGGGAVLNGSNSGAGGAGGAGFAQVVTYF